MTKEERKIYMCNWHKANPDYDRNYRKAHPDRNRKKPYISDLVCKACGQGKTIDDFTPDKRSAYGHLRRCKDCINKHLRERRREGMPIDASCEICGAEHGHIWNGVVAKLAQDHDHVTNQLRGYLCRRCNLLLGSLGDSIELLQNCVNYLQRYSV